MPILSNPPRLIVFAGHAGTGKSTLAKKALPLLIEKTGQDFCFLDKDTVYGAFSSHVMQLCTNNPNDRDSPFYLENLRDWEYSGLLDLARENLSLGINVLLVGPFSREIQAGKVFSAEQLGIPRETHIQIAWIDLIEEEAKRRMQRRDDPRDQWKLEHWDQYATRRIDPPNHPALYRFDNLHFDPAQFEALIQSLVG